MAPEPIIAIVDDEAPARAALIGLIRSLDHAVVGYAAAHDLLAALASLRPRCLVADIRLPGMTGIELCRRLVRSVLPVPTILVTAYADDGTRAAAMAAAAIACLAKPIDPDELNRWIRSALGSADADRSGPMENDQK